MEYLGLIFGIFGLCAFAEVTGLKKRLRALEDQMAKTKGTTQYEERQSLFQQVQNNLGQKVKLSFKNGLGDIDVLNYGSNKNGSVTVMDTDGEWVQLLLEGPKGNKEKLIRLSNISGITK